MIIGLKHLFPRLDKKLDEAVEWLDKAPEGRAWTEEEQIFLDDLRSSALRLAQMIEAVMQEINKK